MDSDDFYQEFADWCRMEKTLSAEEDIPTLWKRFTPDAMELFGKLLALDAGERCAVGAVREYVDKDWLKKEDGSGQPQAAEHETPKDRERGEVEEEPE